MKLLHRTSEPKRLGGMAKMSEFGFSAEKNAYTSGVTKINATTYSHMWRTTSPAFSRRRVGIPASGFSAGIGLSCSPVAMGAAWRDSDFIVHPPLLPLELQGRDDQDDREQDPRGRGGQPERLEDEALLVD